MDIIISARHMDLTESMKYSVIDSLSHIKNTYKLNKAEVVLDVDHKLFRAEIVLHGNRINLDAKAETENMHESIDKAVDRLIRQLEKKATKHNHKGDRHLGEIEAENIENASQEDELEMAYEE
ncbi:MAG: ribosome-associated translation inhibitor RaiA [Lentisphaeraceae bacterium]|nr:ribosome-associated translation inhibitor RaiA [Lentisphaeraceae bacterium]